MNDLKLTSDVCAQEAAASAAWACSRLVFWLGVIVDRRERRAGAKRSARSRRQPDLARHHFVRHRRRRRAESDARRAHQRLLRRRQRRNRSEEQQPRGDRRYAQQLEQFPDRPAGQRAHRRRLVGRVQARNLLQSAIRPNQRRTEVAGAEQRPALGRPRSQTTNVDSSASGQTFIQSFAGFSSKTFGTITFGRQNTVLADGVAKYDPNYASQAFSLIGISGTHRRRRGYPESPFGFIGEVCGFVQPAEGVGATSPRSTNSINPPAAPIRPTRCLSAVSTPASRAMCTTPRSRTRCAVAALSAAQVDLGLQRACAPNPLPAGGSCVAASPSNALAATISDNTAYAFMGLYNMGFLKFFGGYEHIQYANPDTPLERRLQCRRLHDRLRQCAKRRQIDLRQRQDLAGVSGPACATR